MPRWWRCARVALTLALVLAAGVLCALTRPCFDEAWEVLSELSGKRTLLLAVGGVALLMPYPDEDLIAGSRRELYGRQIGTLLTSVFAGGVMLCSCTCFAFGVAVRGKLWAYLLLALVFGCALALPLFYRLAFWRLVCAAALFLWVFLPLHEQYAF